MSDETSTAARETDELLRRLQNAHRALMRGLTAVPADRFQAENADGDSVRRILERSADDINFYYGQLVARAVSLPQPPEMQPADFGSVAEAEAALRAAHRSFSHLLHDLTPDDLERATRLESTAEFTLRQVLETAIAHYKLRAQQIKNLAQDS